MRDTENETRYRLARMIFGVLIFLCAALLFIVELILAKALLPMFGGAANVWTASMMCFQFLLLAGYAYAHILSRLRPRFQSIVQMAVLFLSAIALFLSWKFGRAPLLPGTTWGPVAGASPLWQIVAALTRLVGLPFFVLAAASPMLQRWYSQMKGGAEPYRLYALSNAGSVVGLLSYPLLIEPSLTLQSQAWVWSSLFAVAATGIACLAWRFARNAPEPSQVATSTNDGAPFRLRPRIFILLLSACTSAMFLAVTNHLCQEVAVFPFLWVLPLAIYLVSFIICFDRPRWYVRSWALPAGVVTTLLVMIPIFQGRQLSLPIQIAIHTLFLFSFCMTCHAELVLLRPGARDLTIFYLLIALGGALGSAFVAICAPQWFKGFWEFNIALMLAWVLLALHWTRDRGSPLRRGGRIAFLSFAVVVFFIVLRLALYYGSEALPDNVTGHRMAYSVAGAIVASFLLSVFTRRRFFPTHPLWPRLLMGVFIFMIECFLVYRVRSGREGVLAVERNFYGVVRVRQGNPGTNGPPYIALGHGTILHGRQFLDKDLRRKPTTYYGRGSGVALAIEHHVRHASPQTPMHIGVLGLGAGTMAAYARPGDAVRFYEINPAVIKLSAGPDALFTYVRDCLGTATCIEGDARLAMQRELEAGDRQKFDVLVLDAFSSDSVPVHLLTVEAFKLYLAHLRDAHSIIAANISNRFLDLTPVLVSMARRFGLDAILVKNVGEDDPGAAQSNWFIMTRDTALLGQPGWKGRRVDASWTGARIWTDDYSNLLVLLKWDQ